MAIISLTGLPGSFTSLYRLFLRACSASVLHHSGATKNIRRLYRPVFEAGARLTKELQHDSQDRVLGQKQYKWMHVWNKRIDNTLLMLYTSSQCRGQSHQLTRNLGFLVLEEVQRLYTLEKTRPQWNPQSPPDPKSLTRQPRSDGKKMMSSQIDAIAVSMLSEAVKMAEGRENMSLGRIKLHRLKHFNRRSIRRCHKVRNLLPT